MHGKGTAVRIKSKVTVEKKKKRVNEGLKIFIISGMWGGTSDGLGE